jgi:hypothetical protein
MIARIARIAVIGDSELADFSFFLLPFTFYLLPLTFYTPSRSASAATVY